MIDGMFVRSPSAGNAASSKMPSPSSPKTAGRFHIDLPQLWKAASTRPGCSESWSLRGSRTAPALILVPRRPKIAGKRVSVAASTATTDSMIPIAMLRNAGLGTIKMTASDAITVTALNATALPAVSMVSATAAITTSRSPGVAPRRLSAERKRITTKRA